MTEFDCVFWFDDFNTRFVQSSTIRQLLDRTQCASWSEVTVQKVSRLRKLDQLYLELQKARRRSLEHFVEVDIRFAPTYKFILDSCLYHWARRVPAYTDRILYRKSASTNVRCRTYTTITSIRLSDHLPVYATFELTFK